MPNIPLPDVPLPSERRYRAGTLPDFAYVAILLAAGFFSFFAPDWHYRGHIVLLAIFGVIVIAIMRARALVPLYERQFEIPAIINAGEFERANEELDHLIDDFKRAGNKPGYAIAVYNRGMTTLVCGDADRALSLLAAALSTRVFENKNTFCAPVLPLLLAGIGRCYAVKGNLNEAEKWHDLTHEMLSAEREGVLYLLQTLTNVRRGNFAVAVNDAEKRWASAEGNLSVRDLKLMRVLCVFACERMNKPDAAESWLLGVSPFIPGEFDYVSEAWPDFREFLARRGLSRTPAVLNKPASAGIER